MKVAMGRQGLGRTPGMGNEHQKRQHEKADEEHHLEGKKSQKNLFSLSSGHPVRRRTDTTSLKME